MSPLQYLIELRLRTALKLLETTTLSVKEIMHKVGVSDQSHFTRDFKKHCRLTPAQYRRHCRRTIPGQ
jgi:transcriptional regulator GlxA family with amidase domain